LHINIKDMVKEKIRVESFLNPALAVLDNQNYILPNMIKVDMNFTLDQIEWIKPSYFQNEPILEDMEWPVESSKKVKKYLVKRINNEYSCNCTGFGFRRDCSHIQKIKFKYS
jgi:hypothetical protein